MGVGGTVRGGVVVLDTPVHLPDGTRVKVEVIDEGFVKQPVDSPGAWIDEFAGCVEDAPADASLNYHQKLYGARKR